MEDPPVRALSAHSDLGEGLDDFEYRLDPPLPTNYFILHPRRGEVKLEGFENEGKATIREVAGLLETVTIKIENPILRNQRR